MRLIDADKLKDEIGECPENWLDSPEEIQAVDDWNGFMNVIDCAPTIDAEPVRHGHWNRRKGLHLVMKCDDYGNPTCKERKEHTFYLCSECERRTMIKSAYCPACGCKMLEETE